VMRVILNVRLRHWYQHQTHTWLIRRG